MTTSICTRLAVWAAAIVLVSSDSVSAQVLGTFRWNLAPHCNVLTLRVEQQGALYLLTGTDDQCSAPVALPASGTAHINPNGTASLGITVIRPDGIPVSTNASINLMSLSGTWSDEYGNGGTFQFNPAGVVGQRRMATLKGNYAIFFQAIAPLDDGGSPIAFGRALAAVPQAPIANVIPSGGSSTVNCPGSFSDPQAAPGHLCVYEGFRANGNVLFIVNGAGSFGADSTGAGLILRATAAGDAASFGKWAVTPP